MRTALTIAGVILGGSAALLLVLLWRPYIRPAIERCRHDWRARRLDDEQFWLEMQRRRHSRDHHDDTQ